MPNIASLTLLISAVAVHAFAMDEMTVYDLLAPESNQFAIRYDVSATKSGSNVYYNIVRPGSAATDEKVIDRATGKEMKFQITDAREAKAAGQSENDVPDATPFIKIPLPHQVPKGGEYRLRIFKTYKDPKSYFTEGDKIIFDRSLSIKRNIIILPAGYELIESSVPVIVHMEKERVHVSMVNERLDELEVHLVGRRLKGSGKGK